jgi:hypothetical protein
LAVCPCGHVEQLSDPGFGAMAEPGQSWQADPLLAAKVPGAHGVQLVAPVDEELPAGHATQDTLDGAVLYVPTAQGVQLGALAAL